jgi:hypothetical protein
MATNTNIQFLAAGEAGDTSNRRQTETYIAKNTNGSGVTVTINAGDWVEFDSGESGADRVLFIKQTATGAALGAPAIGVALDTISLPEPTVAGASVTAQVRVAVAGYVADAAVTTGVAADAPLSCDGATAGRAEAADAANAIICGVCLDTAAGNRAPVYVYKRV